MHDSFVGRALDVRATGLDGDQAMRGAKNRDAQEQTSSSRGIVQVLLAVVLLNVAVLRGCCRCSCSC